MPSHPPVKTARRGRRLVVAAVGLVVFLAGGLVSVRVPAATAAASSRVRPDLKRRVSDHPNSAADTVVQLVPGTDQSTVDAMAREHGAPRGWRILRGFQARLSPTQIEALTSDSRVLSLDVVHPVHASIATARHWFGVDAAQAAGFTGALGDASHPVANVAVLDSGIDDSNPELSGGKIIDFVDCTSGTCIAAAPFDDLGHGTHVSGIVGAKADNPSLEGVAPSVGLVGVKVLDSTGSGTDAGIITALDWVAAHQASDHIGVANLSLGGGCNPCDGSDALSTAVNRLWDAGVVVVVAAGNIESGPLAAKRTVGSPAVASKVISVGAMSDVTPGPSGFSDTPDAGYFLAPWSARGPTSDGRVKPELVAPGVAITSTCSHDSTTVSEGGCASSQVQSATVSGTSMASPFVAGVVALMRAANPALTPSQIRSTLQSTAVSWGPGLGSDYGAGRLDAAAAVAAAANSTVAGASVPGHLHLSGSVGGTGASSCWQVTVDGSVPSMTATLLLPTSGSSNNLDLFLRRADDVLLSASQTTFRQDLVYADNLATGAYKVIVASASGTSSYDLDISNATGAVRCGGTSFIAADAGPSPAAARSGYTDGPVSVAFPVTVFPNPSAWMVTVDDATPSNPAPPATDDPRWKAMSDLSLDLAAAVAAAPGGDGSHVLYPWLKDASGNVSPASDAAAASAGLVLDRSSPVVSVTAPVGGPFSSRSTIRPEWSTPATPTSALATLSYVVGSVVTTVASGAPATGSWTWKVPDTAATGARFRVAVTSPGGHVGSADSAPFDELGLGGFWVDGRGAIHPYGGAPSIDESPRWSFTIARGLSLASGGASGYLLDGWGGIHPFASNGSSPPPALAGGPYFPGFDIARALALRPAGGAYLLDGWGGIHAVGGAPAVSGGPYWRGWDIARDLVLLPGSSASGYVLDGWGGLHPFGGAPAATSGPYWRGWDIARRLVLGQDGQTGYVLDGFGGIHPVTFSGATHSPKAATSGPYWNGWDIARGFTLLPDESGGYLLDGYGGIHAFGLAGGAVPALSSSGYVAADVARGVAAR